MYKYLAFTFYDFEGRWHQSSGFNAFVFRAKNDEAALAIILGQIGESTKLTSIFRITGGLQVQKVPICTKGIVKRNSLSWRGKERIGFTQFEGRASLIELLQPIKQRSQK